jgi:hypothetical protein
MNLGRAVGVHAAVVARRTAIGPGSRSRSAGGGGTLAALVAVRSGGPSDPLEVARMRMVVSMGMGRSPLASRAIPTYRDG